MLADIIAMGNLYGLSTTTRTGDTTYGFNTNSGRDIFNAAINPAVSYTVFDSGGTDTLDYSGFAASQRIDLNPEAFSNVGGFTGNVSIARGVVIENAIGGAGNDLLLGNAANNVLTGNAGNDTLRGGAGTDTLIGGAGNDVYLVDNPGDIITELAGAGSDTVVASASYVLGAGVSVESMTTISASATTAINLTGNELAQSLYGNAGNNILTGMRRRRLSRRRRRQRPLLCRPVRRHRRGQWRRRRLDLRRRHLHPARGCRDRDLGRGQPGLDSTRSTSPATNMARASTAARAPTR